MEKSLELIEQLMEKIYKGESIPAGVAKVVFIEDKSEGHIIKAPQGFLKHDGFWGIEPIFFKSYEEVIAALEKYCKRKGV
jgi:hypothetical protein